MPSLPRFLRSAQHQNLVQHATRIGLDRGEANDQSTLDGWVLSACSPAQREQLVADMEKIMAMTDEIGQAAMLQLPDWREIAPLHAVRAHTPGTGKSLLVDVASTIATGRPCPVIAAGRTEEETEKRLGALLRDAVPVVRSTT